MRWPGRIGQEVIMLDTTQDAQAFLNDFGVPVAWTDPDGNKVNALGILEDPNQDLQVGFQVTSVEYSLVYATADMAINDKDPLTIDGRNFVARGNPNSMDDGVFSRVLLKKVG